MSTTVENNTERSRYEITVDGELAGYLDYFCEGDEYALPHTNVFSQFEGRGLGSELVATALDDIRAHGGTVLPYCPFIPKVIRHRPEFVELVPEDKRVRFGL